VKGTDSQPYVGNPRTGSIHNYGLTVDLSLEDGKGYELDMGTPFDYFAPLAQHLNGSRSTLPKFPSGMCPV